MDNKVLDTLLKDAEQTEMSYNKERAALDWRQHSLCQLLKICFDAIDPSFDEPDMTENWEGNAQSNLYALAQWIDGWCFRETGSKTIWESLHVYHDRIGERLPSAGSACKEKSFNRGATTVRVLDATLELILANYEYDIEKIKKDGEAAYKVAKMRYLLRRKKFRWEWYNGDRRESPESSAPLPNLQQSHIATLGSLDAAMKQVRIAAPKRTNTDSSSNSQASKQTQRPKRST